MDRSLLDRVLCPACGRGDWTVEVAESATLDYSDGPRDEVRTGEVICPDGHTYPVRDFVLSFAALFPPDLQREAAFWDRFYLWNLQHGALGFHDLRRGFAPFLAHGVRETFPLADTVDRYDIHYEVAEHPALRAGRTLLDVGVGLGWTSIHFARAGYAVTAFDPSLGPVQAAKAYAIGEGRPIEYLCAAVGYVDFRPASFDNVAAFHSLHHVPDLAAGLEAVARWLRPGGGLAVDEHVTNSRLAGALGAQLHGWAAANVFPRYRTIPDEELAALPQEPHSALEDVGADQVLPLIRRMFDIQFERPRHVVLDHYPLLYYLWRDRDETAYRHALEIANQFQELLRLVDADGGEYVTIVATNRPAAAADDATALPATVEGAVPAVLHPPARAPEGLTETGAASPDPVPLTPHWAAAPGVPPAPAPEPDRPAVPTAAYPLTLATEGAGVAPAGDAALAALRARVAELEGALAAQGAWAHSLEAAVHARDRELARLRAHLRRVENGRIMRLLRLLHR